MNSLMQVRNQAKWLLVAITSLCSYGTYLASLITWRLSDQMYEPQSEAELRLVLALPTRLLIDYWFVASGVMVFLAVGILFHRKTRDSLQAILGAVWLNCFLAWIALFCAFYMAFQGAMCLHHGPDFELDRFVQFGYGAFPVTLLALLAFPYCLVRSCICREDPVERENVVEKHVGDT